MRVVVTSAVVAVLVAGCGGEAVRSTRREYVTRVNEACADAVSRHERLLAEAFAELEETGRLPEHPGPAELQLFYASILPAARASEEVIRGMLAEVRSLAPPEEIGRDAARLWDAYEARLETGMQRIEEAVSDPAAAVELNVDDTRPFTPENRRASALGFTACSFE